MLKLKRMLISLLVLGNLVAVSGVANAAPAKKETEQVKTYDSLKTAASDYAKALQEISNYGSREMLKSINPDVDVYIAKIKNPTLKKQWEDTNTMLLEQFEVSVYKVDEKGDKGTKVDKAKGEVEVDIDKYIKLQYEYLKKTKKINLATSTINFKKDKNNKWQVVK